MTDTVQRIADAIAREDDETQNTILDDLQARLGWSEANRIWQAGCDLFDAINDGSADTAD